MAAKAVGSARCARSGKNASLLAWWTASSRSRKSFRNRRERTRTGRKKPGLQGIQRDPPGARPPPGTTTCTCGWWLSAEPHVCSTAVRPILAPRCFGSAAIVRSVSAARCCRDPTGSTLGPIEVAGQPSVLSRDARLALQAEPGPTPPHPGAEAQGHELARVRREPAPAWQLDVVFGRGGRGVGGRAAHEP